MAEKKKNDEKMSKFGQNKNDRQEIKKLLKIGKVLKK